MTVRPVRRRQTFLVAAAVASLMVGRSRSALAQRRVVVGVLRDWPPRYLIDDDGEPTGFAIESFEAIVEGTGLEPSYRVFDRFADVIEALEEGEIDVIPNLGIIPERRGRMAFTAPIETFAIGLFVRRASTDIRGLDDLKGRRVGAVESNRAVSLLRGRSDIKLVVYPEVRAAFFDLLAGRLDGLAYPKPVIESMAVEIGVQDQVRTAGEPLAEIKRGIAVRVGEDELFRRLDDAVRAFLDSSTYPEIYSRWFAEPPPFWTVERVVWGSGGGFALIAMGFWAWRRRALRDQERDRARLRDAEDAQDQAEDRFRMVLDHASDGIFISEEDGRYVHANQRACDMLGYTLEELRELTVVDVLAPGEIERQPLRLDDVVAGERPLVERRLRSKGGSIITAEINATRLSDGRLMGIARDVTERKRAQALIDEQRELLRQAQKMEALGRLAGSVAHDFNNLLTAISSYGEMLVEAMPEGSDQRADAEALCDAASQGQRLTRQLLTFSRKQVVKRHELSLDEVVTGDLSLLERLVGDHAVFDTALSSTRRVVVDPAQIEQVIMNLVINARDAVQGAGRISLRTFDIELEEPQARRHGATPGPFVVLEVRDDGAGMDDETRLRIFEPFFTTKGSSDGTGLGLATVHAIVTQSGGFVDVESAPGEGATFAVHLPAAEGDGHPENVADAVREVAASVEAAPSARVLVVDDDPLILRVVQRALSEEGFVIVSASSGEEALELVESSEERFDLVVTDVVMPGIKGTELARRLGERHPDLRVLFMSGYTDVHMEEGDLQPATRAFIPKPFRPTDLTAAIEDLLREP